MPLISPVEVTKKFYKCKPAFFLIQLIIWSFSVLKNDYLLYKNKHFYWKPIYHCLLKEILVNGNMFTSACKPIKILEMIAECFCSYIQSSRHVKNEKVLQCKKRLKTKALVLNQIAASL